MKESKVDRHFIISVKYEVRRGFRIKWSSYLKIVRRDIRSTIRFDHFYRVSVPLVDTMIYCLIFTNNSRTIYHSLFLGHFEEYIANTKIYFFAEFKYFGLSLRSPNPNSFTILSFFPSPTLAF